MRKIQREEQTTDNEGSSTDEDSLENPNDLQEIFNQKLDVGKKEDNIQDIITSETLHEEKKLSFLKEKNTNSDDSLDIASSSNQNAIQSNIDMCQSTDESDLEDLSNLNRSHRPYRDNLDDDYTVDCDVESTTSTNFDAAEVRKRVKKSLVKKQQASRRKKKGEAGAVTRIRREKKDDVKQSVNAFHSGW